MPEAIRILRWVFYLFADPLPLTVQTLSQPDVNWVVAAIATGVDPLCL